MSTFFRLTTAFFYYLFRLLYRLEIKGVENIPAGPALIAANHTSYFDPPLIGASVHEELHFLAKANLFRFPIFGRMIRNLNAHPVSGTTSDLASFKLICQLIVEGKKVVIFPEGGRSVNGELLPIRPGVGMLAMRCDAPIIPTYIKGLYEAWPMGQKFPKPWGRVSIHFGRPIDWHDFKHLDRKQAQEAIAEAITSALIELKNRAA